MFARRISAAFPLCGISSCHRTAHSIEHLAEVHAAVKGFVQAARERMDGDPRLRNSPRICWRR